MNFKSSCLFLLLFTTQIQRIIGQSVKHVNDLANVFAYKSAVLEVDFQVFKNKTNLDFFIVTYFEGDDNSYLLNVKQDPSLKNLTERILISDIMEQSQSKVLLEFVFSKETNKWKGNINLHVDSDQIPIKILAFIESEIIKKKFKASNLSKPSDANCYEIFDLTMRTIIKAMDDKWKKKLLNAGKELIETDSSYHRGYYHIGWNMPYYYYDFIPYDSTLKSDSLYIKDEVQDKGLTFLPHVIQLIKDYPYHNDIESVSQWKWLKGKTPNWAPKTINYQIYFPKMQDNPDNFHLKSGKPCRLRQDKKYIDHGQKYPPTGYLAFHGWYATYCNFFAIDLGNMIFGKYLWDHKTYLPCSKIYPHLPNNENFIQIDFNEAWDYAEAGFLVHLVTSDHISTPYPDGLKIKKGDKMVGNVIQAGATTGIKTFSEAWGDYDTQLIKSFVYVGHLRP